MSTDRTPPHLATLVLPTALSVLSLNMFLPSLASIADDFETSNSTVSLAVGGYLAVTAVVQLIAGPLSDRIGRRPVMLGALLIFSAASLVCALANDIWVFLAFRMLQAGTIAGYAVSLAIVRDTTTEQRAAGLIGYITMAMAIAPMLGPMLGGVLDATFGWRANFYFYAMSGVALFALCWVDLGETRPETPTDQESREPLSFLLKEPLFWAYSLTAAFSTAAFYIFLTGAPLVAVTQFDFSTAELGVYIGSITGGFMLGGFLTGKLSAQVQPISLMLAGRLIACIGPVIGLGLALTGTLTAPLFFGSTIIVGLGNGLTTPSSSASAMSVRPRLAGSAAGLSGALVVSIGAVVTSFTGWALPEEAPATALLWLMLVASGAGLGTVLWAIALRRRATS